MKSHKQLILSFFVLLFFFFGSAVAQTCYSPNYGYYDCNQSYSSYPDVTQALIEGAVIGIVLGGFNNNNDGGYERNHWRGNDGQRNWGGQHGGGWYHNGGHHH